MGSPTITLASVLVIGLLAAALPACSDHKRTYFTCTACLVDDPARCAANTPVCGDPDERSYSEIGAKDALCDTLSPAALARRPTPTGFTPNPYLKNACYEWPADAFKTSCTTFTQACSSVPIH